LLSTQPQRHQLCKDGGLEGKKGLPFFPDRKLGRTRKVSVILVSSQSERTEKMESGLHPVIEKEAESNSKAGNKLLTFF
jgi:hypothetical protein